MKLPMRGTIKATGEDAEMWNNLDGWEEWEFARIWKVQKNI